MNKNVTNNWKNINWDAYYKKIKGLQKELVVVFTNNDKQKLFKLQQQLFLTFEARALAVKKVTTNKGKNTPGVDNVLWKTNKQKFEAIKTLRIVINSKLGMYKANKIKRIWLPKTKNEKRPLGIPTLLDRALQALVLLGIDPIVEQISDVHSYGFRKFKSINNAIQRLRTLLIRKDSPKFIYKMDIEKCFDKISHKFLLEKLSQLVNAKALELCEKWLTAPIVEANKIVLPTMGTPQGGIISPLFCNVALNGLENIVRPVSLKTNQKTGNWVVRYADDVVITSKKLNNFETIIPNIKLFLSERNLNISEQKSKIIELEKNNFDFLGWNFSLKKRNLKINKKTNNQNSHVLVVKPDAKSIKEIKMVIKTNFSTSKPIEAIIRDLNPVLRGWSNYYRTSYHSQIIFIKLNHYIYQAWERWAKRINPKNNRKQIHKKYICKTEKRSWRIGNKKLLLFDLTQVKTINLTNLKSNINPYVDEEYYLKRKNKNIKTD